jgi:anti-sigma-K factor RskA
MEPQDNKKIALQKALSAHEQAQAALADLADDARYATMIARIQANLADLRGESHTTSNADQV